MSDLALMQTASAVDIQQMGCHVNDVENLREKLGDNTYD